MTNGGFYVLGIITLLTFVIIEFISQGYYNGDGYGNGNRGLMRRVERECGILKKEVDRLKGVVGDGNVVDKDGMREVIRKEVLEEMKGKGLLKSGGGDGNVVGEDEASKWMLRLPPCAERNSSEIAQSFLMVFMGHSGSSAILSEMGQHKKFWVTVPEPVDHGEYEQNTTLALQYADEYFTNGTMYGKIAGFKMRPFHIMQNPQAWRDLVKKHKTRIIWQFRANVFKQAVGEYTHEYLGDNAVIEGLKDGLTLEERCKTGKCRFKIENMDHLHQLLVKFSTNDEQIKTAVHYLGAQGGSADGCVLPVAYEDYLYGRKNIMRQIHAFMGVEHEDHPPTRRKATKDNMCEAVENFDQVCDSFYGCAAWRWMMDDHINGCKCTGLSVSTFAEREHYCATRKKLQRRRR